MSTLTHAENRSEYHNALRMLEVFSRYGFRKTSMSDIGNAAGVSRQSIYNRFGSKEAVFDWALESFMKLGLGSVDRILDDGGADPVQALIDAHQSWLGDHVGLWNNTPHGAEILGMWGESKARMAADYGAEFGQRIQHHLRRTGLCENTKEAEAYGRVLKFATLGLMSDCTSPADFKTGMELTVGLLFRR